MLIADDDPLIRMDLTENADRAMTYLAKPFSTATLLPAIELTAARYAEAAALRAQLAEAT